MSVQMRSNHRRGRSLTKRLVLVVTAEIVVLATVLWCRALTPADRPSKDTVNQTSERVSSTSRPSVLGMISDLAKPVVDKPVASVSSGETLPSKADSSANSTPVQSTPPTPTVTPAGQSEITVYDLLTQINAVRIKAGAAPLSLNEKLNTSAGFKAADMITNNYWAHTSPAGVEPWHWFTAAGYPYRFAGEVLAMNYDDAAAVVSAWLASPSHRADILNPAFREVGFAVAHGRLNGADVVLIVAHLAC